MGYEDVQRNYVLDLSESINHILTVEDSVFRKRGLGHLNMTCLAVANQIIAKYREEQLTTEQAYVFLGEWLHNLLSGSPEYLLTVRAAYDSFYRVRSVIEYPFTSQTEDVFLELLLDGRYFIKAKNVLTEREKDSSAISNTIGSYINAKQKIEKQNAQQGTKKFSCYLTEQQIVHMMNELVKSGFISDKTKSVEFKEVFLPDSQQLTEPIVWLKKTNSLAYLLYKLHIRYELIEGNWQTNIGNQKRAFIVNGKHVSASNFSSMVSNLKKIDRDTRPTTEQLTLLSIVDSVIKIV